MYSQRYPTTCTCLCVEEWELYCLLEAEFVSQIHMIMAFDPHSGLIKTKDDMVYGIGINVFGRLGFSKDHSKRKPEKVDALCGKNIKTFYNSIDHTCMFAFTEKGEVYSWGYRRLGRKLDLHTVMYIPAKIDCLRKKRIIDIASNNYNSLALTDSGKIYVWASDFTKNSSQDQPYQVTKLKKMKIVQIACGESFVMALTNDGKLYSWGINEHGQLGISSKNDCMYPCLITSLENVQIDKIVCGSKHSLALTSKGHIYSWGSNSAGQLGYGEECEQKRKPTKLKWTANGKTMGIISDIAAQRDVSAAVNKLGSVYVWGCLFFHIFVSYTIWKPIKTECSNMYNIFRDEMSHIIYRNIRERSNLLRHLETIFDDQSTSDFTIEVEGKHIHVHKAILIRCDYFKNMLQHGWREAKENTVKCNDFPYNVYKVFLKYFYTDVVDHLSLEEAFELLKLCDKCMEETLAIKCMQMIEENINVSNVVLCFAKATECNAEYLVEYCVQFSSGRMSDITKSGILDNLSKELLLDFISKTTDAWAVED